MSKIKNANVLVTGGANGIGKIMSLKALQEGCATLVIWDINEDNLQKTQEEFVNKGFKNVHTFVVDVSDVNDIESAATKVLLDIGNIDILFNNAGVVAGKKYFWEYSEREIEKTININVNGVMHVTRVFIKDMIKQNKGHIINIASASSLISLPKGSVYASSKWAVLGWSESLRKELEQAKTKVHVTTICPSYIDTGMFKGVKAPFLFPLLKPDEIVDKTFKAIKNDVAILMEPGNLSLVPMFKGILPAKVFDVFAGWLGVYNSMDTFEGRNEKERIPQKSKK